MAVSRRGAGLLCWAKISLGSGLAHCLTHHAYGHHHTAQLHRAELSRAAAHVRLQLYVPAGCQRPIRVPQWSGLWRASILLQAIT